MTIVGNPFGDLGTLQAEPVADADGNQDLAFFFLTDSNTNEPRIFHLELS